MKTKEKEKSSNKSLLRIQEFVSSFTEEDFKNDNVGMLIMAAGKEAEDKTGVVMMTKGCSKYCMEALYNWTKQAPGALEAIADIVKQISKESKSKTKSTRKK